MVIAQTSIGKNELIERLKRCGQTGNQVDGYSFIVPAELVAEIILRLGQRERKRTVGATPK